MARPKVSAHVMARAPLGKDDIDDGRATPLRSATLERAGWACKLVKAFGNTGARSYVWACGQSVRTTPMCGRRCGRTCADDPYVRTDVRTDVRTVGRSGKSAFW